MTKITHLVTHSGTFHADDVCAATILAEIFPTAHLIRTRNKSTLEALEPGAITFDVGGRNDPERRIFDHHQPGRELRPGSEVPYSSFGLVWKYYGAEYLRRIHPLDPAGMIDAVHARMDAGFVRNIDALDNGVLEEGDDGLLHADAFAALINDHRPSFDAATANEQMLGFRRATDMARTVIKNRIGAIRDRIRGEDIIADAIENRTDPRWIEMPYSLPYDQMIHAKGADDILYAIYPTGDEWRMTVVRKTLRAYPARKPLPETWAGLRDADLEAETGVKGATFCHLARFTCAAKTCDAIMKMLDIALDAA